MNANISNSNHTEIPASYSESLIQTELQVLLGLIGKLTNHSC